MWIPIPERPVSGLPGSFSQNLHTYIQHLHANPPSVGEDAREAATEPHGKATDTAPKRHYTVLPVLQMSAVSAAGNRMEA